jgi:adhesin/invasin
VSLFGSGLCSATEGAPTLPLPTNLANVQVSVNGVFAPISYVSPNQINVVVPFETASDGYATFQVSSDTGLSNAVTLYERDTSPGVFTSTNGGFAPGVGPAAALHADFSPVSQGNPAQVGETLLLYVTGLGAVKPAVADGAAAVANPLSVVVADIGVLVDGQAAVVTFQGLAPGFAGLYQVNFVVPGGVSSGLVNLEVSTPDALTNEAKVYIR